LQPERGAEERCRINKNKSFAEKAAVLDIERGALDTQRPLFWQTDTSIDKRSGGISWTPEYKTARQIVGDLI
jgi:hypothetical protein